MDTRYIRDTDVARRYGVSRNSVWRLTRRGRLPQPIRLSPGCTRWSVADLDAHDARLRHSTSDHGEAA